MPYELFHTSYSHNSVITVLQCCDKSHEGFSSFRCAFVYTGIFQNAYEYMSNFLFEDIHHIIKHLCSVPDVSAGRILPSLHVFPELRWNGCLSSR